MANDTINLKGKVTLTLTDELGNVKQELTKDNLIVTIGKTFVASRIVGATYNAMSHVAIGSSNTAPGAGDTTLNTETARVAASATSASSNASFVATYGAGVGTGTVAEAGIFNNSSGGEMLSHVNGLSVTKGANDTLSITWTVSVS